jgi:ClpX C4-type zinc finger
MTFYRLTDVEARQIPRAIIKTMTNIPAPPPVLDSARVLHYAVVDDSVGYTGRDLLTVGGVEIGRVPCLAICKNEGERKVLLFHCDHEWTVLGCSRHDSVEAAKRWIERNYPGLSSRWIEAQFTDAEVDRYLEELYGEDHCSFCGKRPDQVDQMIAGGNARICDRCIGELHKMMKEGAGK